MVLDPRCRERYTPGKTIGIIPLSKDMGDSMSTASYAIRYRSTLHHDSVTLIVEDQDGRYYFFSCRPDHCQLLPMDDAERHPAILRRLGWRPVPAVAPYSLDALRVLMSGALMVHQLPPSFDAPPARQAQDRETATSRHG